MCVDRQPAGWVRPVLGLNKLQSSELTVVKDKGHNVAARQGLVGIDLVAQLPNGHWAPVETLGRLSGEHLCEVTATNRHAACAECGKGYVPADRSKQVVNNSRIRLVCSHQAGKPSDKLATI